MIKKDKKQHSITTWTKKHKTKIVKLFKKHFKKIGIRYKEKKMQ